MGAPADDFGDEEEEEIVAERSGKCEKDTCCFSLFMLKPPENIDLLLPLELPLLLPLLLLLLLWFVLL